MVSTPTRPDRTGQGTRSLTLERRPPRGKLAGMGNMPSIPFWVEHRTLPGPVAYLTFNAWMEAETVAKAFQAALAEAGPEAKGFILDLRGNPGGIGGMAMGAAGWFTAQSGLKLGTMSLRGANLNFVVFPRPNPFTKPLAILVDGGSASTSEICPRSSPACPAATGSSTPSPPTPARAARCWRPGA